MKQALAIILSLCSCIGFGQQPATIKEYPKIFKTYPFSDPDPIPRMGNIYPYFRFDGYTDKAIDRAWNVVELENEFISVMILPEIGGKIWAATDKASGKPFLYYNHVVKFRDIAMRGPWTSGGIEANYGIIGHTPNCATPVDYLTRQNDDGSVSCFIGTLDLLTQSYWTLEINLPKDKAYFTTRSFWSNTTPLEQPYYTWMNAGIKAAGDLEFVYPGTRYLGHDGSNKSWKTHEGNGKDISFYEKNDFGPYKSYHVFGKYTDFFGGFWHKENFGMGRYASHDEKAGKKIWIWGLSQQGMIWENLLSDTDGQYVEVQSGRLFNQTDHTSTMTPFKHRGFAPYTTDTWTEYWFPVKGTQGFVTANPAGSMNVRIWQGRVRVDISPLSSRKEKLTISQGGKALYEKAVDLKTLQLFSDSVSVSSADPVEVMLGDHVIEYKTDPMYQVLARPVESPKDFDWNSIQGLYLEGKEFIRERQYVKAEEKLHQCLEKDPHYLPALTNLAMVHYRNMEYQKAMLLLVHALSIDTYDPAANFYYGLTSLALDKQTDARDGFDIASMSPEYRVAATTELSRMDLKRGMPEKAIHYANKSLDGNGGNIEALQLLAVSYRLQGDQRKAGEIRKWIKDLNPLNHFVSFEDYVTKQTPELRAAFATGIRNELAVETYLELAAWYYRLGRLKEMQLLLEFTPANAEVMYWQAWLDQQLKGSSEKSLERAVTASVLGVFPFRPESAEILQWAVGATTSWKPKYLLALIYWSKNQIPKTREMIQACGDQPDFAPFYAARADFFNKNPLPDLQRAATLDPKQWRYGKLMIQSNPRDIKIAKEYDQRFPNDFRIRLLLAQSYLLNKDYTACLSVLSKTNVLPFEGATTGHAVYREALLSQAIDQIKMKKFAKALDLIGKARKFPPNLGVGKPYDADIDSRAEYFLEGVCYEGLKNSARAKAAWDHIETFESNSVGTNDMYRLWALTKLGKQKEGEDLLNKWLREKPDNRHLNTLLAFYRYQDLSRSTDDIPVDGHDERLVEMTHYAIMKK